MKKRYNAEESYKGFAAAFLTYPITEHEEDCVAHAYKIEVYGDEELRDKIVELLNKGS